MSVHNTCNWFVDIDQEATGERLRNLRLEHHLTQQELSDAFGRSCDQMSRRALIRIEKGRGLISLPHIAFLAVFYNRPIDELIVYRVVRFTESDERDQLVPDIFLFYSISIAEISVYINNELLPVE